MKRFAKAANNFQTFTLSVNCSILNVSQGSSEHTYVNVAIMNICINQNVTALFSTC